MTDSISKILSIVLIVLLAVSFALAMAFFFGGVTPESAGTDLEEPIYTDTALLWMKLLLVVAALVAVLFPVIGMITNPKSAIKTVGAIAVLAIVILISYAMASDAIPVFQGAEEMDITNKLSKNVGMGLHAMYVLLAMGIIAIVATEIIDRFK